MDGRMYKRGRVWWIQYNAAGRKYRESAKTSRKEAASALLRERVQAIWNGTFFPGKKRRTELTMQGLLDLWLRERATKRSLDDDQARLGAAVEYFNAYRLVSTIEPDDIAAYRKSLADGDRSQATINRYLAVLRSALNLADLQGHRHQNPMRGIKLAPERGARNRVCSHEEYRELMASADVELRACIAIGYGVGMRFGEIVNLTWDRIDLKAKVIRLSAADTKEASVKTVPIPDDAIEPLALLVRRIDGRVFAYRRDFYTHAFANLCSACKIEGLHFHDLRHTAVTNMRRAGVDIVTIADITGHKTLAMLQRYNKITDDDKRAAMAAVQARADRRTSVTGPKRSAPQ